MRAIQTVDTNYTDIMRYFNKDWNIEAYDIHRKVLQDKDAEYEELGITGHSIYFLYEKDVVSKQIHVYVGRSSDTVKCIPAFTRLRQHDTSTTESYRDKWDKAIIIKFKELSFDDMRHLENYFFKELKPDVKLNSIEPDTDEYTYDDIKNKVEYIKEYLKRILKCDVFKEHKKTGNSKLRYTEEEKANEGKPSLKKQSEVITEVQTPLEVVNQMLDALPASVWSPDTKFLDLACKSGEYLKEIFNRLMSSSLYDGTPFESEANRTIHIITTQLYGVALTDESYKLTCKNLSMGEGSNNHIIKIQCKVRGEEKGLPYILKQYHSMRANASIAIRGDIDNNTKQTALINIGKCKENLLAAGIQEDTFEDFIKKEFGVSEDMKFNVVIGNPPYQGSKKSIYNDFIDTAIDLRAEYISMIVKNNWLVSETLQETRANMIKTGLTEIINYPETGEIFNNIGVAVSIFTIQRGYVGDTYCKEIRKEKVTTEYKSDLRKAKVIAFNKIEQSIINKFSTYCESTNFGTRTYPSEPFRITTNGMVGRGDNAYELAVFDTKSDEHNIEVVYMNERTKQPYSKYTSIKDIPSKAELVSKYKVLCGRILTRDNDIINNIRIIKPNTVCTSSWGMLFTSNQESETKAVEKYIKTKLFRFLVRSLSEDGVIAISPYRFSLVPDQNFTSSSDIDWEQSIDAINKQLYVKYRLSDSEIDYIESIIKPISNPAKTKITEQAILANYVNTQIKNSGNQ